MPAGWVAAAATVYSAYESHQQAKKNQANIEAAQAQAAQRAEQNIQLNRERYQQAQQLLSPYIAREKTANEQLMAELGLGPGTPSTAYMQTPGYRAAMQGVQQLGANAGTLYSGRRIEDSAAVQSQFYNNYMNLLQNMANPAAATNLANIGIGQAGTMGSQALQAGNLNLNATIAANEAATQGTEAQNAALADITKGFANYYNQYQNQQQANQSGTTSYV